MKRTTLLSLLISALVLCNGAEAANDRQDNCFSLVVGKDASADGWVIMAHNEDDYIPQVVNHHKIPRRQHGPDDVVELTNGGTLEQAPETWAYIWSEIPGLLFSDSYLNEWGVCICSDACPSREDQPELTDGGISYMLRRLVAERARTSREGVHIAGELIERFGYASSGRTYTISDPNEGWLLCAVNGKHWVAQRVPDDKVAVIANTYTVHEIDLAETLNFLGSADVIDYAIQRGWYDPETDGAFDFAVAYADPQTAVDKRNLGRQWDGLCQAAADPPAYNTTLPFSVRPSGKVDVRKIAQVLRRHYEDTELYAVDSVTGCPHSGGATPICRSDTQTSFIAQLRGDIPPDIGLVYWVCLSSPCLSCYVPFHFGIEEFPAGYCGESVQPTEDHYRQRVNRPFEIDPASTFWTFTHFRYTVEQTYADRSPGVRKALGAIELEALSKQATVESQAAALLENDREAAIKLLTGYSQGVIGAAMDTLAELQPLR